MTYADPKLAVSNPRIDFESGGYSTSYFNDGFNPDRVISIVDRYAAKFNIDFDSFVCLGLSSSVIVPVLAYHYKLPFLALRKPGVKCHDYGIGMVGRGTIGKRWLFVDDFVSSGRTVRNAIEYVDKGLSMLDKSGQSQYVGTITYNRNGAFIDPDFKSHNLVEITSDDNSLWIDGDVFDKVRELYSSAYYNDLRDCKGYAINHFKKSRFKDRISLKDLSAVVVFLAKQFS